MWNPFAKKYYLRWSGSVHPCWSHELIEVQGVFNPTVYRGLTFYSYKVDVWDHEGQMSFPVYTYTDGMSSIEPATKEQFEMLWSVYHVTDKQE